MPGNESSNRLVDALIGELAPATGNVPGLSAARRDKRPMAQAVAGAGIPHLRTFVATTEEAAAGWLREWGRRWSSNPATAAGPTACTR
jgi:hypothetical protein